ncbi:MAG: hypothetical protein IPM37_11930 [Hahellaceae bacterium]|nr:hypothetical protein [Hahellaceae bacterium]
MTVPAHLQDVKTQLTAEGFAQGTVWYHGTSSALLDSIQADGLKRSGDRAMRQAVKKTLATIGENRSESIEPVFITPSRELAYFWAQQTIKRRGRFEGAEEPVVLALNLPADWQGKVRPDVGAAALLMVGGNDYLTFLQACYADAGLSIPDFETVQLDRLDYLRKLGMAYMDCDIPASYLQVL